MSREIWTTSELMWLAVSAILIGITTGIYIEEWMCDCPRCAYEKPDHSTPTQENPHA